MNRRAFLRGAGTAVALPWLEKMAHAGKQPKRLVIFFTGSGTMPEFWKPAGTETDFTVPEMLAPLAPHKQDLVFLTGIDNVAHMKSALGVDHPKGMGTMLTGAELLPGDQKNGPGDKDTFGWPNGHSVDQEVARHIGQGTRFRSLELAVNCFSQTGGSLFNRMIFAGPNQPVPPEDNPRKVFQRLFASVASDAADWERLRAERKSVLDQVAGRYARLVAHVGAEDRRKLEAHLQAVREIERGLDARPSQAAACRRPDEPGDMDFRSNEMYPAAGKLQMDMLAMALACDLSRVISLQWNKATSSIRHTWVDVDEEHHELSHSGDKNQEATEKLTRITTWYAQQYAYLLQKLKSIPEGDGTLLDNTLVLWTGEIAKGNSHSPVDKPYLLGGRAGGALRTGRWLDYGKGGGVYYRGKKQLLSNGGEPVAHNDLLVSVMNAMGVDKQTFGNPLYCSGPLRGLL